ncbi:MAG: HAD family hydrolase [Spirochaetaceae bacterium]|nr:HAD family hydrolase [Spirochaetaceae bacterium]
MRKPIRLFDLGNTLVEYFRPAGFTPVLRESIRLAGRALGEAGHPVPPGAEVARRVAEEDHTARNYRVRPLHRRLARIFALRGGADGHIMRAMSRAFMEPIFATARRYDDTLDTLSTLRRRGYRIGILSNTPWGTPPWAWHEELERHGLAERCDLALFCGDVGWRKPARPLFRAALSHFACRPEHCVFVGDDPRWDVRGARRAGITPLLIDRTAAAATATAQPDLRSLADLEPVLQRWNGGRGTGVGTAGAARARGA